MRWFKHNYIDSLQKDMITVLDIGSRRVRSKHETYRSIFEQPRYNYTGMDIKKGDNVDIVGYDKVTDVYDIVINGQVLEHVRQPWELLKKWSEYFTHYICVIAPHRGKEHRYPIDTYRYFPDGMKDLFSFAGIKMLKVIKGRDDTMAIGTK